MSIQAIAGPRLDLNGPGPVAPEYSLLSTPGVVVERDSGRWLNGVNIVGYPDGEPSLWEPCSDGTFATKAGGDDLPQATFDPFVVYVPVECLLRGARDILDFSEATLGAVESFGVEQYLAQGIPGSGSANPYLADSNVVVLNGGTAVKASLGFSFLEDAIAATGRQGLIHSTPAVNGALGFNFLRECDPDGRQDSGDEYLETANSTTVISGQGYIGATGPGLTDPDYDLIQGGTEQWIFATGPVEVRLGPIVNTTLRESLDREDNLVVYRAERYVLATWDTALQVAVLVDWST